MEKRQSIRVSQEVYGTLLKYKGEITIKEKRVPTMNEIIEKLMNTDAK